MAEQVGIMCDVMQLYENRRKEWLRVPAFHYKGKAVKNKKTKNKEVSSVSCHRGALVSQPPVLLLHSLSSKHKLWSGSFTQKPIIHDAKSSQKPDKRNPISFVFISTVIRPIMAVIVQLKSTDTGRVVKTAQMSQGNQDRWSNMKAVVTLSSHNIS